MEIDKIKNILEDFYNGEATPEEEQILLQYFRSNNVTEELLDEKEVFLGAYDTETIEVPTALESKLNTLIDKLDIEDNKAKIVEFSNKPKNKLRRLILTGSVAASLVIMISVGLYINKANPIKNTAVTVQTADEQKQIEEAQQALLLLSENFNKGVDHLSLVSANIEKTNGILNKTLNRKNN